jgi:hypothetical protein
VGRIVTYISEENDQGDLGPVTWYQLVLIESQKTGYQVFDIGPKGYWCHGDSVR